LASVPGVSPFFPIFFAVKWRPVDTRNMLAVIEVHVRKAELAISVLELPNALRTAKVISEHAVFQNLHQVQRQDFCWRVQVNYTDYILIEL